MLKSSQPTTPAPISPQVTDTAKDASKPISLPAGVTAFNDYKALVRGADQFLLLHDAHLLRDYGVLTTIDRGIASTFQLRQRAAVLERDEWLEELKRQVAELSTNKDRVQMEHKAEVDNLLGQLSALMVKCENIVTRSNAWE
ncbi:hypothetical protein ACOSQ2_023520 [Xanthoceras sorbifolium]